MQKVVVAALAAWVTLAGLAGAENWGHWRGPTYQGTTTDVGLPTEFGPETNAAWRFPLESPSASTPVVWDDHVFLTCSDGSGRLFGIALDRRDGSERWRFELDGPVRRDERSTYAAPSPVTDGKVAVFFFSTGDMLCFEMDGNELWRRNIMQDFGEFAFQWTFSSSPLIEDGTVVLQVLQRDVPAWGYGMADRENKPYLLAIDAVTGRDQWRHIRPTKAVAESREAFTSPVVGTIAGKRQLVVVGGDCITGHSLSDGAELWRWGTYNPERKTNFRTVPSPVVGGELALLCAPQRNPIYMVRPGSGGRAKLAWDSTADRTISSDVPTPAFVDGDFILLSHVRSTSVMRLDGPTGKVEWETAAPTTRKYEASPLVADGKVYVINFDAQAAVLDLDTGRILYETTLEEPRRGESVRSSLIASDGQLFAKTTRYLWCFGERQ